MVSPTQLDHDALAWLLQEGEPGVRYLALRDLAGLAADDPALRAARTAAHTQGPIAKVLAKMQPQGYWVEPDHVYSPKYRASVWALILLAQLGAALEEDERVAAACQFMLDHSLAPGGQFCHAGTAPSGTIDCLQGNLCWALTELGCRDPRLEAAYDWMARTVTGEGIAPVSEKTAPQRYYAYKCGPDFACGANNRLPCAWGAAKVMLALGRIPAAQRTPAIQRAIQRGVDFLFSVDPAHADYPSPGIGKPSGDWWKFGFPVFYITDILQIVEALAALGYGCDPRLVNAVAVIRARQGADGRWLLEFDYNGKTWGTYGEKKQPNPWVTLRALRVLRACEA